MTLPFSMVNLADGMTVTEVDMDALRGNITALNDRMNEQIVGHGWRDTSSTPSTVNGQVQGALRVDNIPVLNGQRYLAWMPQGHPTSNVTTDTWRTEIRYLTGGGAAVTTSPVVPGAQGHGVFGNPMTLAGIMPITSTGVISVLITISRTAGTGNVQYFADGVRRLDLLVLRLGSTVANQGIAV